MRLCIPSRGRAERIMGHSLRLFPYATVVVAEGERDDYFRVLKAAGKDKQLVLHPDPGSLPKIFNWMLDNFEEDCLAFAGDDLVHLASMVGWKPRKIADPDTVEQILENTAECAAGFGAKLWGYINSKNPLHYVAHDPICFDRWVGGLLGVWGRTLRFDEKLKYNEDVDLALQCLLKHRILYQDTRFYPQGGSEMNAGGLQNVRSPEQTQFQISYLQGKWGPYLGVEWAKSTYQLKVRVDRRQPIQL